MQCMILFPGRDGRLPSAEELRRAGFVLSTALGRETVREPALAAEAPPVYGAGCGREHGAEYGAERERRASEPEAEAVQG